ncbi:response regulator transcription factor [[Clostridium] dakarense]|uniref:response regulator transcription factor n=1 Tax=Faecalimicrobium dakarense TaxID=1301100 RepID=UPI0004B79CAE|nr:response regulator transcription factor [[Clostridium] dakarense]
MYSVYLLDDEPFILEGLRYIVPWEEYGFNIVGSASNGEDGFNEIIKNDIDLIITDIMMPKMTGLELISKLKEENYETNFIVLSAFQEFKYAKKAMNMGAENYLLKPIDTDELSENLKNIYKNIKLKEKNMSDKSIVKNNLLLKLLTEEYEESATNNLEELNIVLKDDNYCVAMIELSDTSCDIGVILKEKIKNNKFIYCIKSKSSALLIVNEKNKDILTSELSQLKADIMNESNSLVYISVGKYVNSIKDIYKSYKTSLEISEYKMIYSDKSWVKFYKEQASKQNDTYIEFEELKKMLVSKDISKTSGYINQIFGKLKNEEDLTPKQIKMKSVEIFLNVYNYFNESKIIKDLHKYFECIVNNHSTVDEIEIQLINMLKHIQTKLEQADESISPVILKLLEYIEENYKYDLNLKEISDKLNINAIYLGQLFQRETGTLFSDYINNFRVNKAKKLLSDTTLKASEIGILVGYTNKNYFYRKFKNIAGVTPSEWRKINL